MPCIEGLTGFNPGQLSLSAADSVRDSVKVAVAGVISISR
jgi:hypothetical protein